MSTQTIAPAPGRKVRRPDQGFAPLPDSGAAVTWSPYWERALQAGDIVVVEPVAEIAPVPEDAPTPKKARAAQEAGGEA